MKSITVEELKSWIDNNEDFQMIDVREQHEFDAGDMGGTLIPMGEVPTRHEEISRDKKVVLQCRSGKRSANVLQYLEQNHNMDNCYNLEGGILAWIELNK